MYLVKLLDINWTGLTNMLDIPGVKYVSKLCSLSSSFSVASWEVSQCLYFNFLVIGSSYLKVLGLVRCFDFDFTSAQSFSSCDFQCEC